MGANVDRECFDAEDHARFAAQLQNDLKALRALLAQPNFGVGPTTLGAELELSLVDGAGLALPKNLEVVESHPHRQLALELNRFNVEYNLCSVAAAGQPLTAMASEMNAALTQLRLAAAVHGGELAVIGILPTLRECDLQSDAITDVTRYHALSRALRELRGAPFQIDITGDESLRYECDDVTLEGAATSFQVHVRVPPSDFADLYDATQLATAPALALSTNSPTFLGKRLWRETRVALFKQSVDSRTPEQLGTPPRVLFGRSWLESSAYELFALDVAAFQPILPAHQDDDPAAALAASAVPPLSALRLHCGTVWHWNRAVFDPAAGGHLRIELRALPSGPTVIDMMASAAFALGLSRALQPHMPELRRVCGFEHAQSNFFEAAQHGMNAQLIWPDARMRTLARTTLPVLMPRLLEHAHAGLDMLGVDAREANELLALCAARVEARTTGACWQLRMLDRLEPRSPRFEALVAMLQVYLRESRSGVPVHEWSDAL
jgi:gamma-glutamyl:cysteine ligase YbdK (ATP-grasp superfamily)